MTIILIYLTAVNIVGFVCMGVDKRRAVENEWRISEATLFTIAILGGAPGCIVGMYTFRHKTKHIKFTVGMPLVIIVQIAIVCICRYMNFSG